MLVGAGHIARVQAVDVTRCVCCAGLNGFVAVWIDTAGLHGQQIGQNGGMHGRKHRADHRDTSLGLCLGTANV